MQQLSLPLDGQPGASYQYQKGLVVFSGGQDSTTCLALALKQCREVVAVTFDYGQRHAIETACAKRILTIFGAQHTIHHETIRTDILSAIGDSALVGTGAIGEKHARLSTLPASFVPNRNALMLTVAHALAQKVGAEVLYTGTCQTDYSGYPDCRREFIDALESALNLGSGQDIKIITPLMYLTKGETFDLANSLGCLGVVLEYSHTCYEGDHTTNHEWGYGCGVCPACELRAKGWEDYLAMKEKVVV